MKDLPPICGWPGYKYWEEEPNNKTNPHPLEGTPGGIPSVISMLDPLFLIAVLHSHHYLWWVWWEDSGTHLLRKWSWCVNGNSWARGAWLSWTRESLAASNGLSAPVVSTEAPEPAGRTGSIRDWHSLLWHKLCHNWHGFCKLGTKSYLAALDRGYRNSLMHLINVHFNHTTCLLLSSPRLMKHGKSNPSLTSVISG